jgi:beta-glucosidase
VSDGPSGIRIGRNHKCTSLPSGYVFASSFDDELTQQIFELEGVELFVYNIDALLGPGMNIHRHPLCGRNFEYFSEDPLLSGKMAAAQSRGLSKSGTTATIKHFACNNQEVGRGSSMVAVSERALREIYLKGYEIAVKEGNATAIMTAYTPVNGYWTSSHYDLNTTILRNEWGYKGIVMTDWWASCGEGVRFPEVKDNLKIMVRAHNDLYMVCERATSKPHNILEGIEEGYISRGDLQYCAKNILTYIMKSPTFMKYVAGGCVRPDFDFFDVDKLEVVATYENIKFNQEYEIPLKKGEKYVFSTKEQHILSVMLLNGEFGIGN